MAISGLPAYDLLNYQSFLDQVGSVLKNIEKQTTDLAIVIGAPFEEISSDSRSLYSGIYFMEDRKTTLVKKKLIFSENRSAKWRKQEDRKSTRLNSSHVAISYAVFCLKKKNTKIKITNT